MNKNISVKGSLLETSYILTLLSDLGKTVTLLRTTFGNEIKLVMKEESKGTGWKVVLGAGQTLAVLQEELVLTVQPGVDVSIIVAMMLILF